MSEDNTEERPLEQNRGQSELETLLVFIVGITVVLAVVPAALGLAGIDIRDASVGGTDTAPGGDGSDLEEGALTILSSHGGEINDDRSSIGTVELLVAPSSEAVDLDDVTVTWDGEDRFELTPTHVGAGDASFGTETTHGDALLEEGDRGFLRFDLGSDDLGDVQRFGDRLEPGDTVTVTVTTGDGAETRETVTVPDPLPPGAAVRFV